MTLALWIAIVVLALAAVAGRVQAVLLHRRLARAIRRSPVDPATGMFSPSAAPLRLEMEAARATRLKKQLKVRKGQVSEGADADRAGRALRERLPAGVVGLRLAERDFYLVAVGEVQMPSDLPEFSDPSWRWQGGAGTAADDPGAV